MDKYFMAVALEEAKKAFNLGEVPIGCVIVYKDKIIAKAHNEKEKRICSTKHAEIIAIEKACKVLETWHLNDCVIYVTVEPCLMCTGAIMQSHIHSIVYSAKNNKFGAIDSRYQVLNKNKYIIKSGILEEESLKIMHDFFSSKR